MEISFSHTVMSGQTSTLPRRENKEKGMMEGPQELRKLYQQEEQLYEEVKDFLFPKQQEAEE